MHQVSPFSEAALIAIHAMAVIATSNEATQVNSISSRMGFSRHHTASVLRRLATSSLVKATRGPAGGYRLTAEGREVSIMDVIEIFDGNMSGFPCRASCARCQFEPCLFGPEGMGWMGLKDFLMHKKIVELILKKTTEKDEKTNRND